MSQQAPGRGAQALRREYGRLFDEAADLIKSFRACPCGADAADDIDFDAMINDMVATRQQLGACHSFPPCDGNNLEDDVSDETLEAIRARLEWNYSVLHEEVEESLCGCLDRPDIPVPAEPEGISEEERRRLHELYGTPSPIRKIPEPNPPTLTGLPAELRSMIWWNAMRPRWGVVRIYNRTMDQHPFNQNVYNQIPLGGPIDHLERHSVPGYSLLGSLERETWQIVGERFDFNVLHANNHRFYWEAGDEFWRRAAADRLMFSFGPRFHSQERAGPVGHVDYGGITSAHTFFTTLIRDNPNNHLLLRFDPNNPTGPMVLPGSVRFAQHVHGVNYLARIRRIHLDLTNTTMGAERQALPQHMHLGFPNSIQYLDNVLDMMYQNCTGLEHLALDFVGWLPDISQTPWVEGPPAAGFPIVSWGPHQSSAHWVTRLTRFANRRVNRLRLRVTFFVPGAHQYQGAIGQHPAVLRVARFFAHLRSAMLTNGQALDQTEVRSWRSYNDNRLRGRGVELIPRIVVEVDDSWDNRTQTFTHHHTNQTHEFAFFAP